MSHRPRPAPPIPLGAPAPAETAVLTPAQAAAWLQISERQLNRIADLPYVLLGGSRSRRHPVRLVLAWLEARAKREGPA